MTAEELEERQKWLLAQKIDHTLATIDQFVGRCEGKVFVSFSGGKDSTVLLDLCRIIRPDILAVFSNTGVEFPEIVKFVRDKIKAGENIQIIRPKLTPKQVWEKYGFPLISKETAQKIHRCRVNPDSKSAIKWLGDGFFSIAKRWRYLLSEAYETSDRCCAKLKKEPFHRYCAETGLNPIIGVMASESAMRKGQYLRNGGCNAFEGGVKQACLVLYQYGWNKIFGIISKCAISPLQKSTIKAHIGLGAWAVASVAHSLMTNGLNCYWKRIPSYTN